MATEGSAETTDIQENTVSADNADTSEAKMSTEGASEAIVAEEPQSNITEETVREVALYANIGISIAKEYVNIREKASTDSEVLGKLYKNSAVEILDTSGDWYHVESGSIKGYVKEEFIRTGIPDEELVEKYGEPSIVVTVDGLNVREKADTEADKVAVIYRNEIYPVLDSHDDWIKINIPEDKTAGYVKSEYAELMVDFKDAISKEEEEELLKLQAEERAKKETEIKKQDSVSYSREDLKLLACLVHSEAGTQSYEGKLAVANVVLNRVKSSKYGGSIKSVIYQPGQFSVANSGSLAKQLSNYDNYNSNSQQLSVKAAKAALEGANNIGSRLYFHSYKAAVRKGYDKKKTSVKLGDHLFW
jgi:spore germination cell wall hydrolase CwlJ-like protein